MRTIPSSELIINDDGSIFHLHLRPEQLADTLSKISRTLRILDTEGNEMQLEELTYDRALWMLVNS